MKRSSVFIVLTFIFAVTFIYLNPTFLAVGALILSVIMLVITLRTRLVYEERKVELVIYNDKADFDISGLGRKEGVRKLKEQLLKLTVRFEADFPNIKINNFSWLNCSLVIEVPESKEIFLKDTISKRMNCQVDRPAKIEVPVSS